MFGRLYEKVVVYSTVSLFDPPVWPLVAYGVVFRVEVSANLICPGEY